MFFKIVGRCTIGLLALSVLFLFGLGKGCRQEETSYMGLPDGAAGLLARYVLEKKMATGAIQAHRFEPYSLYDCCTGASEYAMGSGRLDIAVMCVEAARELVAKDGRFAIAGPVMMNSDIFIIRSGADLRRPTIAVSQKRAFQFEMVRQRFGDESRPVPMLHSAVPFAYARGLVEGAVVDITRAFSLPGDFNPATDKDREICTYVLVNKKALQGSSRLLNFLSAYGQAVREMDDADNLLRLLRSYVSADITIGDVEKWKKMKVRFTCPFNSPRQE